MREPSAIGVESFSSCDYFEHEREFVWGRSWVSVCRLEDVAEPGSYSTGIVATDPVVVVRGKDGQLRGFGNVCPHRNSTIMDGTGSASALQCPYHLWAFRLDGSLATAPDMGNVADFDADDYCLPAIAVEEWNGWVFVNLNPCAAPLSAQLRQLTERVDNFDLGALRRAGTIRHDQPWNWKVTVENFSESYHHAAVHPQTLQRTYPGQRSWVSEPSDEPWFWLDHVSVDDEAEPFAVIVVFPAHMFSIIRGLGMVWFRLQALGARTTRVDIELFLPEELSGDKDLVSVVLKSLREINDEDSNINERVQAGLNSRWAAHGPMNHLEDGCRQLRDWLATRTGATTPNR